MGCCISTTHSSLNHVETWVPALAWPHLLGNLGEVSPSTACLPIYKMTGFLRSLLGVVGVVEKGRSQVGGRMCEAALWKCVHDGEVVSISVFMVCGL